MHMPFASASVGSSSASCLPSSNPNWSLRRVPRFLLSLIVTVIFLRRARIDQMTRTVIGRDPFHLLHDRLALDVGPTPSVALDKLHVLYTIALVFDTLPGTHVGC